MRLLVSATVMVARKAAAGSSAETRRAGRARQSGWSGESRKSLVKTVLGAGRGGPSAAATIWRSTPTSCSAISSADWKRSSGWRAVLFSRNR